MENRFPRPLLTATAYALMAGSLLLVGCQKRTTSVDTPAGTTTTTTVSPSKSATETMARAGDAIGDAAITAKVKTALIADPDVKALRIDVDTKDGVVTLNGTADQSANADKAVAIAKRIDGVKSVENRLTVKSSG